MMEFGGQLETWEVLAYLIFHFYDEVEDYAMGFSRL
jgi:hypothetical protein